MAIASMTTCDIVQENYDAILQCGVEQLMRFSIFWD